MRNKTLRRLTAFLVAGAMIFGFIQPNLKYIRAEADTSVSESAGTTDPTAPPTDPATETPTTTTAAPDPTVAPTTPPTTPPTAPPTEPTTTPTTAPTTVAPTTTAPTTVAPTAPPTEPTTPPTEPTTPPTEPTTAPTTEPTTTPTTVAQKPVQQFSVGQILSTGTSYITVEVTKVWQDLPAGTNPGSVTVELRKSSDDSLVRSGTLTQANGYSITWADIPAVSDPAATYYLREILPSGYVQVSLLEVNQVLTLDNRVTPNNINYANYPKLSFFIMKPTANNPFIVWTLSAMTEADRIALLGTIQAAPDAGPFGKVKDDYLSGKVPFIWLSGPLASYDFAPDDPLKGYLSVNFTIDPITGLVTNYNIDFQESSNWTQYMFGSYSPLKYAVTNKPYTATGSWSPSVTKELAGKALATDMFEFELRLDGVLKQTVKNTAAGAIPFSPLSFIFADVGSHTVTIVEKAASIPGVTTDTMTVTYNLNVVDNGDGTLTVNVVNPPADTIFNNVYRAAGSWTPSVSKALTGRALVADEFTFDLKEGANILQTKKNAADGSIPFEAVNYTLADVGTHTYTITERNSGLGGITHDTLVVTYTVTVTDNGNGTLSVSPSTPADTIFNNSYAATGSFTPSVTKALSGRALLAGEFSFELKEGTTVLQTVANAADGSIPFAAINYTLADVGTHTYTISEKTPVPAGVTRDPMVVTYVVTVSDKGDGTLNVSFTPPADTIFNNSYAATGSFTPSVTKVLTGRALLAGEFSFELKEGTTLLQTVANAANGSIPFAAINYTLADVGVHTYTITEKTPVPNGVTRDPMVVTYVVTVSDKGDGTLNVEYSVPNDTIFNNSYAATGSFAPSVTKVLTGRALIAGEFSFELKEGTTVLQTVANAANGSIPFTAISYTLADIGTHTYTIIEKTPVPGGVTRDPMVVTYVVTVSDKGDGTLEVSFTPPADTIFNNSYAATGSFTPSVTKQLTGRALIAGEFSFELKEGTTVLQTVANAANGSIPFTAINYTLADVGTHTYTISEKTPVPAGVTRDAMIVTYVVTVSDNGDGTLNVEYGVPNDTIFNNSYAATGSFTPSVTKQLSGRALLSGEFSFELKEGTTVLQTKSNLADGSIPFTAINYTLADVGVHTYTITEKTPVPAGVTRDTMTVTYVVTVLDKGDGTLNVEYSVPNDTIFNNIYASTGSFTPSVTKALSGRALRAGEFSFELKEGTTVLQTVANAENGSIPFAAINYTLADVGTHTYTISEKTPVPAGVTRDPMVVTYVVTVSDNGDGTLDVAFTPPADTTFNNSYAATGSFTPSVTKELTGRALLAGEFSFELKEGTTVLQTVANAANGSIPFTAINYTLADVGIHTYTITEKTPVPAGVTRDALVVTYVVTVSDKGDGTLNVSFTPPNDTIFNNVYRAFGTFLPAVTKALSGRTLLAGEFSFELKEGTTLLQTVSNLANGTIPFTAIGYSLADVGVHTYTISEKAPVPGGVTRDPMVVTYVVTVSDKGDGTLNVEYSIPNDTTFNNSYAATGSFTPSVTKQLIGRALIAGEFSFELKEGTTVLQTVANAANGSIPFAAINYTLADVGTHTYSISEKTPVPGGVTRDPLVVTYVVTVSDKGDGTLNVEYSVPNDTIFNNSYAASGSFTPSVTKELTGRALAAGEFTFELREGTTLLQTRTNTAAGAIPFAAINYTLADVGVHTYSITELAPVPAGVTRDALAVVYTVTVSDKGDGTLNVEYDVPNDTIFNNLYTALPVDADIEGTKVLEGRDLLSGEFTFELYRSDNEGNVAADATPLQSTANVGGTWKFTLTYNQGGEGTYFYVVREVAGSLGGVTYDTSEFLFRVDVTDDGLGHMEADVTAPEGGAEFDNLYTALPVDADIEGTKVLEGRDLATGEFSFELYMSDSEGNVASGAMPIQTVSNVGGTWKFTLTYGQGEEGTYYYMVREVAGSLGGVTYDTSEFLFRVDVTDDGVGHMVADVMAPEGGAEFNNLYEAEGSFLPVVTKVLEGRVLEDGNFTFELTEGLTLLQSVTNKADGSIPFVAIPYTLADVGTHTYTIRELPSGLPAVLDDPMIVTFVVTVSDNGDGTLSVEYDVPEDTEFNNRVNVLSDLEAYYTPEVKKDIQGTEANNIPFTFELRALSEGAPLPDGTMGDVATLTGTGSGIFRFDMITFTEVGTYVYEVKEVNSGAPGYTYDQTKYILTIKVELKEDLTQEALLRYLVLDVNFSVGETPAEEMLFTNLYNAEGSFLPEVTKELEGRPLAADEFTFTLTHNGEVLQTVKNLADGKIPFLAIPYTMADVGVHTYEIRELPSGLAAILDDPMVVTYVVTVADKGDGTLDVSYEVPDDTIFNNRLNVLADLEVYYTPEVVKVVTGKDAPLTEFTFELRPISEGAPMPEGSMDGMAVVKGKGAGTFAFGEILFTEEGTYVYEITEKNGGAKDYTYDKAKYTLTIVVTKDETTSQEAVTEFLTLETVITKDGGTETHETMTFTNKYYKVPETGESIWMYVLGGGLVLLGGALFLILNRRNKKNPSEEQ